MSSAPFATVRVSTNKDGKVVPRYYDQDVEAYLMPMREDAEDRLVEVEGAKPSLIIDSKMPLRR